MAIRAVFLDIDDTLLSFEACVREAMRDGFPAFGIGEYRDDMYAAARRVNHDLWGRIEHGEMGRPQMELMRWNMIFSELGLVGDGVAFERFFKERLFWSAVPVPGAVELVHHLSGRYVLCVASNGPYEQQVNRLRVAGLLHLFDHVFVSGRVGAEKPNRAFFDACFEELCATDAPGLLPEETLMVGDSVDSDMAGGAAYGMRTCLYRPGGGEAPEGVDLLVTSLDQLRELL